jgi:hypothetical protein
MPGRTELVATPVVGAASPLGIGIGIETKMRGWLASF